MTVSHKRPVTRWRQAASLVILGLLAALLAGCPDDDNGNTAPRAANDTATTTVGTPVTIRVLDNDADADDDRHLDGQAMIFVGRGGRGRRHETGNQDGLLALPEQGAPEALGLIRVAIVRIFGIRLGSGREWPGGRVTARPSDALDRRAGLRL